MMPNEAERDGVLPRLLASLVAGVCRRPGTVLLLAGAFLILSLYLTFTRLTYQTSRKDVLSPHSEAYKRWLHYVGEFGEDEDMVVVVKGKPRAQVEASLEYLAAQVAAQPNHFDRLFYKVDLQHLQNRALLLLPADKIRQIQSQLQDMSLLLELPLDPRELWKSVNLLQLVYEGERRIGTLGGTPGGAERFLEQLASICRTAGNTLGDPQAYRNPWTSMIADMPSNRDYLSRPQYFFSGDGALAFLLVRPVRDDDDGFAGARKSIAALREILKEAGPHFPDLQFGLTGVPVLENDEVVASQQDSQLAGQLSLLGVAVLYLAVFRGWRQPAFIVIALLAGMVWSLGWLTVTVGHLNILSAAFVVMLIGMGDYGVLWVTRYGAERRSGLDRRSAMRETAIAVGPSIVTAGMTTATAFFAAMLADFRAVAELGWVAGCGVLLCALSCLTVMPALLMLFDRREYGTEKVAPLRLMPDSGAGFPACHEHANACLRDGRLSSLPHVVFGISLLLALVLGCFISRLAYRHNLLDMQARGLDSVRWEETLLEHARGASWHALCYTATPEEALALKARFEKLPEVSQVHDVAALLPRDQDRKLEQLRDIQQRLRRLPERGVVVPHRLPHINDVKTGLDRLAAAARDERYAVLVEKLRPSVLYLLERLAALTPTLAAERLQSFDDRMTHDLAEDLYRLRDVSTPKQITIDDLPESLRQRYIGLNGQWLLRIFARASLWEYEPLERFCAQVHKVDPTVTGRPFLTLEGLRDLKQAFSLAAVYAAIAMLIVVLLDFRDWRHTALVAVPVLIGMAVTFGLLALFGVPLNPANLIAVPLILGVGADYGVHVVHDFRARGPGPYAIRFATGQGILITGLTTILGFGTLMFSQHRGLASLGLVLTLGVTSCMVAALVSLPALLRLVSVYPRRRSQPPDSKLRAI